MIYKHLKLVLLLWVAILSDEHVFSVTKAVNKMSDQRLNDLPVIYIEINVLLKNCNVILARFQQMDRRKFVNANCLTK